MYKSDVKGSTKNVLFDNTALLLLPLIRVMKFVLRTLVAAFLEKLYSRNL